MLRTIIASLLWLPLIAAAQPWPAKPIRMIVTYPAGGGAGNIKPE